VVEESPLLQDFRDKPVLLVDIDGVVSLFGFASDERPAGTLHSVEGIPHLLSATAARHLHALAEWFDPVWCSGWEERAGEHLPALIGAPAWPHLSFDRGAGGGRITNAHWKLAAIDAHAGARPAAWVDDALDERCEAWAAAREAAGSPTLLLRTNPAVGLTDDGVRVLQDWAAGLRR